MYFNKKQFFGYIYSQEGILKKLYLKIIIGKI